MMRSNRRDAVVVVAEVHYVVAVSAVAAAAAAVPTAWADYMILHMALFALNAPH